MTMCWTACSSASVRRGLALYRAGDYDKAAEYFANGLKDHPESTEFRTLLFKSKMNSYYYHLAQARKLKALGKKEEAIKEYKLTLQIFPDNKRINDELETLLNDGKEKPAVPFQSTITPPVQLNVDPNEKMTLNLRNAPIKQIFAMLGKAHNVNFIFDKDFRDFVYTIDSQNSGFYEILNQLCMVAATDYRVLDPNSVLIFPDTTFKKRTFGLRGTKVFFLKNTKADEAKKLIQTLFREQQILVQEDTNLNSLIIRADNNTLIEIERFLYSVDRAKSEVEIDIEILELNRNTLKSIGAEYGSILTTASAGQFNAGSGTTAASINSLVNVNDITNASIYLTLPSAALHFLETADNTRIISKPNLRGVDGEEIKFSVGDDIPIPQTQFQAGAAGGFNNIPVTSYQYRSVGVEIKITPLIHRNREVTLKIKLKLDFITGYRDNFPTLGKRELESIIRLKEGETNIIGGFIKDEVRKSLSGFPGLAHLPLLGKLFGYTSKGVIQTDLVFSITPRVIREVDISGEDKGAIWSITQGSQNIYSAPVTSPAGASTPEEAREARPGSGSNSITIAPPTQRRPVNSELYFTLRANSTADIASLSFSGTISGGKVEIVEVKTDFAGGDNSKIMKNIAGENFDIGYNFENNPIKSSTIAQLKVKFLQKGTYTVSLSSINAFSRDRKQIEISSNAADIEIFDVPAPGTAETPRGEIQNEGDSERAQADKEKERERQLMRE
jgi:type II secretory pathway component GspD/PulD (secretin)